MGLRGPRGLHRILPSEATPSDSNRGQVVGVGFAGGHVGGEGGRRGRCRRRGRLWMPATVWSKFWSGVAVAKAGARSCVSIGKGLLLLPGLLD